MENEKKTHDKEIIQKTRAKVINFPRLPITIYDVKKVISHSYLNILLISRYGEKTHFLARIEEPDRPPIC